MKKVFSVFVGALFLTGMLGVSSSWAASSMPSVPGASGKVVEKAIEKGNALTGGDKAKTAPIDINSATLEELQSVKGIGEKRAKSIVKNRPYKRKDELVTMKIVPQATYDDIKDQIIAKQAKDTASNATDMKSQVSGAMDSVTKKIKK